MVFWRGTNESDEPLSTSTISSLDGSQIESREAYLDGFPRPGKFKNIYDFARPCLDDSSIDGSVMDDYETPVTYKPISERSLSVRHITHVKDVNTASRVHDRIMLVIRPNNSGTSYTCLTFCSHRDDILEDEHCKDHAKLTTASNTLLNDDTDGYPRLGVHLGWSGRIHVPQEHAYINLHEL